MGSESSDEAKKKGSPCTFSIWSSQCTKKNHPHIFINGSWKKADRGLGQTYAKHLRERADETASLINQPVPGKQNEAKDASVDNEKADETATLGNFEVPGQTNAAQNASKDSDQPQQDNDLPQQDDPPCPPSASPLFYCSVLLRGFKFFDSVLPLPPLSASVATPAVNDEEEDLAKEDGPPPSDPSPPPTGQQDTKDSHTQGSHPQDSNDSHTEDTKNSRLARDIAEHISDLRPSGESWGDSRGDIMEY